MGLSQMARDRLGAWAVGLAVVVVAVAMSYRHPQAHAYRRGTRQRDVAAEAVWGKDIGYAIAEGQSGIRVYGHGTVERVLTDDTEGSRHQRFILRLASPNIPPDPSEPGGSTILIAHNIDLAPRIPGPAVGDIVKFQGQYEWNEKGGVVHWTHHDPRGRRPDGWLEVDGQRYK